MHRILFVLKWHFPVWCIVNINCITSRTHSKYGCVAQEQWRSHLLTAGWWLCWDPARCAVWLLDLTGSTRHICGFRFLYCFFSRFLKRMITDRSYRAFRYKEGWQMSKLTQCLCAHVYCVLVKIWIGMPMSHWGSVLIGSGFHSGGITSFTVACWYFGSDEAQIKEKMRAR